MPSVALGVSRWRALACLVSVVVFASAFCGPGSTVRYFCVDLGLVRQSEYSVFSAVYSRCSLALNIVLQKCSLRFFLAGIDLFTHKFSRVKPMHCTGALWPLRGCLWPRHCL